MLMVKISTLGILAASSLKRLVCASHTGVSSDGTTLMMRTELPVSFKVTGFNPLSTTLKSGAVSPALSSGPISVRGLPLMVVAPGLSIVPPNFWVKCLLYQLGQLGRLGNRKLTGVIPANVGAGVAVHHLHRSDFGN